MKKIMTMTFTEVSESVYNYSSHADNVCSDKIDKDRWFVPTSINEADNRFAYQRFIDDRHNSRTDKKIYKMVGFVDWDENCKPHYFLSNEVYNSLKKYIDETKEFYEKNGWNYTGSMIDPDVINDKKDIDIRVKSYPIEPDVFCKAAIAAHKILKGE